LLNAAEPVLSGLFDAITEIQSRLGGKWSNELPHLIVTETEQASGEKQQTMFSLLLGAAAAGGTTSALERILRGPRGDAFVSLSKKFAESFRQMHLLATPWAAGRIRSIICALHLFTANQF
jgi:hypothetical protein